MSVERSPTIIPQRGSPAAGQRPKGTKITNTTLKHERQVAGNPHDLESTLASLTQLLRTEAQMERGRSTARESPKPRGLTWVVCMSVHRRSVNPKTHEGARSV